MVNPRDVVITGEAALKKKSPRIVHREVQLAEVSDEVDEFESVLTKNEHEDAYQSDFQVEEDVQEEEDVSNEELNII